ncbi:MAG: cytochrome c oxidase assembly protein [Planctomycetes bacterium]|nr:cytochrome c oxidase assembly protein [Planctomycetota bacterium]
MSPTFDAFLRSWPVDPWLFTALTLTGLVYFRGWRSLCSRDPHRWTHGKLAAFLFGLFAVFLALASPIEPFSSLLLQIHMVQHLLLIMAAPPLLWLGAPYFPLLRGLPEAMRVHWAMPLVRWRPLRSVLSALTHPAAAFVAFAAANVLWHLPGPYELALRDDGWHYTQHVCFLAAGLLFWHPVIRPYPSRPKWSLWLLPPYLLLADLLNTALAALLTFSSRVIYPHYTNVPRLGDLSALDDQAAAGVLMWVPSSIAFLVPLFAIVLKLLYAARDTPIPPIPQGRLALTLIAHPVTASPRHLHRRFDLLNVPLLGRFLRWRHARIAVQLPLLLLAALVILDGLTGPQVGPMNLAGVLPWIHWRGLLVLVLLAAGNFFCFACPFLVSRTLARKWLPRGWTWPRLLRNKWPAIALLLSFFWAYEAFALWDSPWLTAWIALGYFGAAFIIDGLFRGAAFCKYLCPIGQFNFVQSLVSPIEVKVRDPGVCETCMTKDCIRGRPGHIPLTPNPSPLRGEGRPDSPNPSPQRGEGSVRGCELDLFLPRKMGNMDCTYCLDCIHACPHDNIGIEAVLPGAELRRDPVRSGIGRFSQRLDVLLLLVILVFAAFANAAGMIGPVLAWRDRLETSAGLSASWSVTLFLFGALIVTPATMIGSASWLSRLLGGLKIPIRKVAARFVPSLVPMGCAMWLSHYCFHFFTSYETIIPVGQRFLRDHGWSTESPHWLASCCRPVTDGLLRLEIVFLDLGLLLSLYTAYAIARELEPAWNRRLGALAPWAILIVLLFYAGIWIVFQPMEMRGTMPG